MFAVIALVAFWGAAIRLWMLDEPKIALVFAALWVVGFFSFPILRWPGAFFLAYECILAAILLIVERYKSLT